MAETTAARLAAVRGRIAAAAQRAGRDPGEITLVAVSKTQPAEAVIEALRAGQKVFGENRVQEALTKMESVPDEAEWHLIGNLQRNKARQVPGRFLALHTLDSAALAVELNKRAAAAGLVQQALIQLNWSGEASKSGVEDPAGLARVLETVLDCSALRLTGLMTMPDPDYSEAQTRRHFAQIRELAGKLRTEYRLPPSFCELSMGMSHDFEWAVEEGATLVRVGSAIFGERR